MTIRDFLLILPKIIYCESSSEPSRRVGSDERSQHMVSMRNKKNYPQNKYQIPPYKLLTLDRHEKTLHKHE